MAKFDEYNIQLKTMAVGQKVYEYHLDNNFFQLLEDVEIQKGDVNVKVTVNKTNRESELDFELEGTLVVNCDRCLEEMDQPIKTTGHLVVRLGKEFKDDGDDTIEIPEEQGIINVSWFLYEFCELAIPIRHAHPFGQCNKGMSAKLEELMVSSDSFEENFEEDEEDEDF
ncbi:MAG: DUF177 domain-containing protein [Bacteroidales bacterium]|nr:DUF177 domain-containing protein [Bacteroidales bacterium]